MGIEAHVIHPTSVAVSREHRRAKTDRLDTELLKRAFLGWLRGEPRHCSMARVPTLEEEDAKRPNRERENLVSERRMESIFSLAARRTSPTEGTPKFGGRVGELKMYWTKLRPPTPAMGLNRAGGLSVRLGMCGKNEFLRREKGK
jgi:hypothetical protein